MKRIALAIGLAGVLAVTGIVGGAVAAKSGTGDSVSGAVKREGLGNVDPERHFVISAHDGPNGATGHFKATYGSGSSRVGFEGKAFCVRSVGNLAIVGILVTSSTHETYTAGDRMFVRIADNGNPGNSSTNDSVSPGAVQPPSTTECPAPVNPNTPFTSGNVVVQDRG
jgi:hypothetical protein